MTRSEFVQQFLNYFYDYPLFDGLDHRKKKIIADDMAFIAEKHMVPKKNFHPYTDELAYITEDGIFEDDVYGFYLNQWSPENE